MTAKKKSAEPTFEAGLAKLEALADQLEQGELPLNELMNACEEGARLTRTLQDQLNRAKARLNEVKADRSGTIDVRPSQIAMQADEDEDQ